MNDRNLRASLKDIVLVEIGDQMGDYAALLLAGLGAEVIKLEPSEGSPSRSHRSVRVRYSRSRTEYFLLALQSEQEEREPRPGESGDERVFETNPRESRHSIDCRRIPRLSSAGLSNAVSLRKRILV